MGTKILYLYDARKLASEKEKVTARDNYKFLTEAPVGRVILTMAVPTIISMLVTSLYNIVDTFFVGRISTQATAAVGVAFPVMTAIQAFGFFFGQGSGTYISRMLGSRNTSHASRMASTACICSGLFGLLITILGLAFLGPISIGLGSTPTILPDTKRFLGIILLGAPFMTVALTLNNQMRFQGNASSAMIGILSGAVLNVVAVPVFAFGLGLGITGVAVGTLIGQIAGCVVLLAMSRRGDNIRIRLRDFSLERGYYVDIFKGGTPSLTRQGMASISTMLLNLSAGTFGDAAIAGMSIVTRICLMVFSLIIGIGQGFQPVCGFCYGAGLWDRVRRGYRFCLYAGVAFLLICCVPGFIFAGDVIDFLRHDSQVVEVGKAAFRWQIVTWPLVAMITFSNMTLQTSGKSLMANLLASCRNGLFFIPIILLLPRLMGLVGLEICQTVSDALSFLVALPLMIHYFHKLGS